MYKNSVYGELGERYLIKDNKNICAYYQYQVLTIIQIQASWLETYNSYFIIHWEHLIKCL